MFDIERTGLSIFLDSIGEISWVNTKFLGNFASVLSFSNLVYAYLKALL